MQWPGKKQQQDVMQFLALQDLAQQQRQMPASYRALAWLGRCIGALAGTHVLPRVLPRVPRFAWVILAAAGALLVFAISAHQSAPSRWPWGSLLGFVAAGVAYWRVRSSSRNARILAVMACVLLGVWLSLVWRDGPRGSLVLALAISALVAAVVYAWRGRGAGGPEPLGDSPDPDAVVAQWSVLTAKGSALHPALTDSSARKKDVNDWSWTLEVTLAPGRVPEDVIDIAPRVASAFQAARGTVSVIAAPRADRCLIRQRTRDPLAKPIPWREPSNKSVLDVIKLGPFEDSADSLLRLLSEPGQGSSYLISGQTRQGKSALLNTLVAALAPCRDVALLGIDPEGTEFGPWESVFQRPVVGAGPEAEQLLNWLDGVRIARVARMRKEGVRVWTPTPEDPEIVLLADELADLSEYLEAMFVLARKGLKTGIHLVAATQRPAAQVLGKWGTSLRSQFTGAISLRQANVGDSNMVLGPGMAAQGWRADTMLDAKGTFLISSPDREHSVPRRARGLLISDKQVQSWAAKCAPLRPRLGEG